MDLSVETNVSRDGTVTVTTDGYGYSIAATRTSLVPEEMRRMGFGQDKSGLWVEACAFLEEVSRSFGSYTAGRAADEGAWDLIRLCYVKLTSDCRALLALLRLGHYLQGAIIARSADDTCMLMMRLLLDPEDSRFLRKWRHGGRLSHWDVIEAINPTLPGDCRFDVDTYRAVRKDLDDVVHGNYPALALYAVQALGTPAEITAREGTIRSWEPLMDFFLYSCLLAAQHLCPGKEAEAERLQRLLVGDMPCE